VKTIAGVHASASEEETAEIAERLSRGLAPGDWILLSGPLGAGKTAFVRGLARALGIDPLRVHSPTFTLVAEYPGPRVLAHVDLYRIDQPAELDELGLDELVRRGVFVAVEWGERLPPGTTPAAWCVEIEHAGGGGRKITIHPPRTETSASAQKS